MKKYLKFIEENSIEDNEILLYPITSEDVNLQTKKILDEKYLFRIYIALSSMEEFRERINNIIDEAIKIALNDKEPHWVEIDDVYKNYQIDD